MRTHTHKKKTDILRCGKPFYRPNMLSDDIKGFSIGGSQRFAKLIAVKIFLFIITTWQFRVKVRGFCLLSKCVSADTDWCKEWLFWKVKAGQG